MRRVLNSLGCPSTSATRYHEAALLARCTRPVSHAGFTGLPGAMGTAVDDAVGLYAVPDDPHPAVAASRRHRVDGAFEAVEGAGRSRCVAEAEGEGAVVVVAAHVADCHRKIQSSRTGRPDQVDRVQLSSPRFPRGLRDKPRNPGRRRCRGETHATRIGLEPPAGRMEREEEPRSP